MATPTPKSRQRPPVTTPNPPHHSGVTPAWLLRALLITVGTAVLLAYAAVCLLVRQGSWQFILHPTRTVDRTPASLGIPWQSVAFDAAPTGLPRLTGWWIPGQASGSPSILFLHDGQGSLANTLPLLALLHQAGHAIFAIDYRGFGASDPSHPTQASMAQDASAALTWLTETRHLPATQVIPYGAGLGAVLAAQLAAANPAIPAIVLDNPDLHTVPALLADTRARLLPMRLLVQDRFDLDASLKDLHRPRLLLVGGPADTAPQFDRGNIAWSQAQSDPKFTAELASIPVAGPQPGPPCPQCPAAAYIATISRFIDTYVPQQPEILRPATGETGSPGKAQP